MSGPWNGGCPRPWRRPKLLLPTSHHLVTFLAEGTFWAAALIVTYAYLGYPALLVLFSRCRPASTVRRGCFQPTVTVLIIVHNEGRRIEAKIRNCLELRYPCKLLDILVASDGSTDRTEEIVAGFAEQGVQLLALPTPNGKATALAHAVAECRGEILVLCDARQELEPGAVRELVANFADPTVGAVSGELILRVPPGSAAGAGVGAYWRYEKAIRRLESQLGSTVGVTGAIYAIRRELFPALDPRTILDDVAVPMAVVMAGHRVVFEPRALAFDDVSPEDGHEYRRKVRTLAGNFQLVALYPRLMSPRHNRLLWQFVSHKLSRLAAPWCLALILLSSALLAVDGSNFDRAAVTAQVLFYALALGGWWLPRCGVGTRLTSVPYAFVLMNCAAAAALFRFLRGSQKVAWRAG